MLKTNQAAPAFSIANQNGQLVSLSDFTDKKNVVLYFYPKDDTTGCTIEANQFTALKDKFDATDTVILGVSKDNEESHCAFIKKYDLNISLLADIEGQLCESYSVWQNKGTDGNVKMGIVRSTFIIDKSGVIKSAEYGVKADGHAANVYEFIKKEL
ncbi:MAG: peroxiredoxin [Gammaproteobacteria bacterium]|nr:peroxiredoxin [Gammaproteobacteria bacterium]